MKIFRWVKYEGLVIGTSLIERGVGVILLNRFMWTPTAFMRLYKSEIDKNCYECWYMFGISVEDYESELK